MISGTWSRSSSLSSGEMRERGDLARLSKVSREYMHAGCGGGAIELSDSEEKEEREEKPLLDALPLRLWTGTYKPLDEDDNVGETERDEDDIEIKRQPLGGQL